MSSSKRQIQLLSWPRAAVERTLPAPVPRAGQQHAVAPGSECPQLLPGARWAQCPCQQAQQSSANQHTQNAAGSQPCPAFPYEQMNSTEEGKLAEHDPAEPGGCFWLVSPLQPPVPSLPCLGR